VYQELSVDANPAVTLTKS